MFGSLFPRLAIIELFQGNLYQLRAPSCPSRMSDGYHVIHAALFRSLCSGKGAAASLFSLGSAHFFSSLIGPSSTN